MLLQQAADVRYRLISLKSELRAHIPGDRAGIRIGVRWTYLERFCRIESVLQRAVGVEPSCNLCKNLLTRADELAGSKPHAVQTPHRGDQFADWHLKRFRKRLQRPRLRHDLPTLDLAYRDPRQPGRLCESLGTSDITPQC